MGINTRRAHVRMSKKEEQGEFSQNIYANIYDSMLQLGFQ